MEFSKVSYTQILSLADQLNSSATQMGDIISELDAVFKKVGDDNVWSGTAASQTKEMFDKLSTKMPEFATSIKECHDYLIRVVENYKSVDSMISGQQ